MSEKKGVERETKVNRQQVRGSEDDKRMREGGKGEMSTLENQAASLFP